MAKKKTVKKPPETPETTGGESRAKAELEAAQQLCEKVRQEAAEQLNKVREKTVGDVIDGTLEAVRKHPGPGLIVAAAVGFFFGRLLGRWFGR